MRFQRLTLDAPLPRLSRALAFLFLLTFLAVTGPALGQEVEPTSQFAVGVDGRAILSFGLWAAEDPETGDPIVPFEDLIATLEDAPIEPQEVVAYADGEVFELPELRVELDRNQIQVEGLAELGLAADGFWGIRFPLELEGRTRIVTLEIRQRLDEYLAVFRDDLFPEGKLSAPEALVGLAESMAAEHGGELLSVHETLLGGFSFQIGPAQLVELRRRPELSYIVPNGFQWELTLQKPVPGWGLDRLDERFLPLNNQYDYGHDGTGVTLFVVDSGIRATHNELDGRVTQIFDRVGVNPDCNPHGTRVASLAAGEELGVAKNADVVSLRVINCGGVGDNTDFVDALEEIENQRALNPGRPMVVNYSAGTTNVATNAAIETVIRRLVQAGVVVVASAGQTDTNLGIVEDDACNWSPARMPEVITVAASNDNDDRWSRTAFGACVDLFAPGEDVKGADSNNNSSTSRGDGTSYAGAYASGVATRVLSAMPDATPAEVRAAMLSRATSGEINNPGTDSPNLLLFWDELEVPGVVYRSHVAFRGWLSWVANGVMTGTVGESRRAEAFELQVNDLPAGIGICYDVDSRTFDWSGTRCNGQMAGTVGQNKRAERIKIWLTGNTAPGCSVNYRVHVGGSGWQSPRANGGIAGVDGDRIEALEVWLTPQCQLPPPPPVVPPVAVCTAIPNQGQGSVTSTLNAAASYDPNGSIVSYQWDLGNGQTATGPWLVRTFFNFGNGPMVFPVSVTVTDNDNLSDTAYCPVHVDCPPSGGLLCPQ